jgi:hypothetical protein
MNTEKFSVNNTEYVRIDGIWFQYLFDKYVPLQDSVLLEQLYQEKYL